jgi:LysR family transcriptional regulator, glycine cleavage system transcriptional activator
MDIPPLSALGALEAVFRLGSVTRAARELHLTQSAVSHRLRGLEAQLGVELLGRHGRGVRLTSDGVRLARAAGEALQLLRDAVVAVTRKPSTRDVLSISCSPSFAIRFLVPRLSAFRAEHREFDLRVAADDVPVDPERSGVDASVRLAAGPSAGLACERLIDEVVFPVASPRLLERKPALRSPKDLAAHTLLHDEALADEPSRVGWAAWLAAARTPQVDPSRGVRFSHAYLALEAALAGDGVALARRTLVADDLVRGRLVAPFALAVPSGLSYWFATASGVRRSEPLSALRAFLLASLRDAHARAELARLHKRRPSRR